MEDETTQQLDPIYNDKAVMKPREYPRMSKKTKEIVKYIENQLGGQVLELELTPAQIKEVVEEAFQEIIHYMTDTYAVTVPYARCMDMKKYNIDNVERVGRTKDTMIGNIPMQYLALSGFYNSINGSSTDLSDYLGTVFSAKRILNIISTDMDFFWDKPNRKLYVNSNSMTPTYVTVIFKPEYYKIDDIREEYWVTQLKKLALGMCKVILGRIRSKYTSNSAKFQLDGNTLLQEGNQEVQNVRDYLASNKDIFTVLN